MENHRERKALVPPPSSLPLSLSLSLSLSLTLSSLLSLSFVSLREKVPNGPFAKEDWLGEVELQMGPQTLSKKQTNK